MTRHMHMLRVCKADYVDYMGSKRTSKQPHATVATVAAAGSKADPIHDEKLDEVPSSTASTEAIVGCPQVQMSPAPAAKLSKLAVKRMRGWEPVVKPPEDLDTLLPSATSTADAVSLDTNTSVTLLPNNKPGVHTRRAAANLAAVSTPASCPASMRDPLIKMENALPQDLQVITSLPPGGGSRRAPLRSVPSLTQSNGSNKRTASRVLRGMSFISSSLQGRNEEKCDGESEAAAETEDGDGDEEGNAEALATAEGEEKVVAVAASAEEEAGEDGGNVATAGKKKQQPRRRADVGSSTRPQRRNSEADRARRRKRASRKGSEEAQEQQQRIGGLSAAQAMLPPPYRRNRRLRRKLHITEETPVFATHSELRDTMPDLFARAPFSTEEDVLRSTMDWREDPVLLYARLLWEFTPHEFLSRAMQRRGGVSGGDTPALSISTAGGSSRSGSRTAMVAVVKKEEEEEGER